LLGFDIADNRVGVDAGEITNVAMNDCLADDRLIAIWRPDGGCGRAMIWASS